MIQELAQREKEVNLWLSEIAMMMTKYWLVFEVMENINGK